ncbi:MAG: hypothetical protein A3I73_05080 [Omnitrophica bacterium RIFCSPLOWO2_02_FULL_45_16]|nr:MAG: hypothetical protein A3I73_05080 [Omnitrophica bacterium RIFCSPLOWO2_02_FULL_45_16]
MDITLRSAFIISAIIHAVIIAPFYNHNLLRHDFGKRNSVIVDYVVLKDMTKIAAANAANKKAIVRASEAPKIEVKKDTAQSKLAVKTDDAGSPLGEAEGYRKSLEISRLKETKEPLKNVPAKQAIQEAAKKEAHVKSSKDYIDYYDFLKDKIKIRLQENYRFYKGEGDVYLSFTLSANGALLTYNIDRSRSSKDEVLLHVTSASLKAVSPFKPLPKAISAPKMSFNITIAFKK